MSLLTLPFLMCLRLVRRVWRLLLYVLAPLMAVLHLIGHWDSLQQLRGWMPQIVDQAGLALQETLDVALPQGLPWLRPSDPDPSLAATATPAPIRVPSRPAGPVAFANLHAQTHGGFSERIAIACEPDSGTVVLHLILRFAGALPEREVERMHQAGSRILLETRGGSGSAGLARRLGGTLRPPQVTRQPGATTFTFTHAAPLPAALALGHADSLVLTFPWVLRPKPLNLTLSAQRGLVQAALGACGAAP